MSEFINYEILKSPELINAKNNNLALINITEFRFSYQTVNKKSMDTSSSE